MVHIALFGAGGSGGLGSSGGAGGGGGSSGSMSIICIPAWAIPDMIFLHLPYASGVGHSYVSVRPNTTANHVLDYATGGNNGGNASGSTGGSASGGPAIATAANMPLGWQWKVAVEDGRTGTAGGSVGANGGDLVLPVTGLHVTGGTGAGATDGAGGSFVVPTNSVFPPHVTTASQNGVSGCFLHHLKYGYGGLGSGMNDGIGGNGGPGCGGGGSNSTTERGLGGPSFASITWW